MASTAELEDKIKQLEKQLKESSEAKKVIYSRDKKFSVLNSDADVTEWCTIMEKYVTERFSGEPERVMFILEHLERKAKTEVKFNFNLEKVSAGEVLTLIRSIYRPVDDVLKLQQKFYSRNQKSEETLPDYAVVLMDLLRAICDKTKISDTEKELMIKGRFADGVFNVELRRELKRVNDERTVTFLQLRQHAVTWCDNGDSQVSSTESLKYSDMCVLLEKQQKQISELNDLVSGMAKGFNHRKSYNPHEKKAGDVSNDQSGEQKSDGKQYKKSVVCHYCKKLGHYKSECYKLKARQNGQDLNSEVPTV